MNQHPSVQGIGNGSGFFISDGFSFIRRQVFGLPLDHIQMGGFIRELVRPCRSVLRFDTVRNTCSYTDNALVLPVGPSHHNRAAGSGNFDTDGATPFSYRGRSSRQTDGYKGW
jgi:hypothetical protein